MTIVSRTDTTACCLVVGLGLELGQGLDLVSGWLVAVYTTFCCHCHYPNPVAQKK